MTQKVRIVVFGQERVASIAQNLKLPWQAQRVAFGTAACAMGPESPVYFGRSDSSDAPSQQERAR